jgi:uncharacterized protein (DUF1330 family)
MNTQRLTSTYYDWTHGWHGFLIAFDSLEKARGWYFSPAYDAVKPIRQNSTKSRILIVEGAAR